MDQLSETLATELALWGARAPSLILGAVIFLILTGVGMLVARGLVRLLAVTDSGRRVGKLPSRLVRLTFSLLGLVLALQVWGLTGLATSMLATGGVVAVVLGFAFREIGENLLAGLLLSFNRSFEIGDIIESGGLRGRVRTIDLRTVHIRAGDGSDVFIPSAQIVSNPLFNYTRDGLRRGSFSVGIDYSDDPAKARAVVLDAITSAEGVLTNPGPAVNVTGLLPQYQEITGSFWVDAFVDGVDFSSVRTRVFENTRSALMDGGFTVSANIATAVQLAPVEIQGDSRGSR